MVDETKKKRDKIRLLKLYYIRIVQKLWLDCVETGAGF